jgi:hypothetical protein
VTLIAAGYLALMFVNIALPTGLSSPRAFFNLDWITLSVMVLIAVVGFAYFVIARPDRLVPPPPAVPPAEVEPPPEVGLA